jgi:hypothetical protein
MSVYYEDWWEATEPLVYEKFNYIHIGSEKEPITVLTSHDWLTMNTANHSDILRGSKRTGAWNIYVEEAGNYTIQLFRWPKEAQLKLRDVSPEYQAVDDVFPKGTSLPIHRANLRIGVQEYSTLVNENDYSANFNIYLPEGKNFLQTFFYNDKRDQICGAYYVYVTKNNK